jgi:hypothetical protein
MYALDWAGQNWPAVTVVALVMLGFGLAYLVSRPPPAQQPGETIVWPWIWHRGQQMFGATVATASVLGFLCCIVLGCLPYDLGYDLPPGPESGFYRLGAHDPRIDNGQIKKAVAACDAANFPSIAAKIEAKIESDAIKIEAKKKLDAAESSTLSRFIESNRDEQRLGTGSGNYSSQLDWISDHQADSVLISLAYWSDTPIDGPLDSFEYSAIADSERILTDRLRFEDGTRLKQNRNRMNQIRVLLLTAAASFLVGIKTLLSDNKPGVPFPSIMNGAWLPISVSALLVPVVATVYSGIIAFDDDARNSLRYARALAQLEQLHARIVDDVAGDPFMCPLEKVYAEVAGVKDSRDAAGSEPSKRSLFSPAAAVGKPSAKIACLMDRTNKVSAWEQRYEQILNDASNALAQAGDLMRGNSKVPAPQPVGNSSNVSVDLCVTAFSGTSDEAPPARAATPVSAHGPQSEAAAGPSSK